MHIFCYGLKSYKKPQPDIANIQTVFLKTKLFNHNLLFIYKKIGIWKKILLYLTRLNYKIL